MLSCLLSWMEVEWADHTYSLTLTETFIALYVNKGFQCTVGQRLKSTMGAPLLNSHSQVARVQRTYWKECTILIQAWICVHFNFRAEIEVQFLRRFSYLGLGG